MSRDFKNCLNKKKLYRSDAAKALAGKEFTSAGDDLAEAELSLSQKRYKWATIQAYYAMFHAARAMIYSRGYRERSHFCVVAGIELSLLWGYTVRAKRRVKKPFDPYCQTTSLYAHRGFTAYTAIISSKRYSNWPLRKQPCG